MIVVAIIVVFIIRVDSFSLHTSCFTKLSNPLMSFFCHLIQPGTLGLLGIWIFTPLDR